MSGDDEERKRRAAEAARRQQREASSRARKSNDIGRWFHLGISEMRGETRENGWQPEQTVNLPSGRERRHDGARSINRYEFREYKGAKRVGDDFTMAQISKDDELLDTNKEAKGAWVVMEGAPDTEAQRALERLEGKYKDRFRVIEVTQEQAQRAIERGREIEQNRDQFELFDSSKWRTQQRAKELRERAEERERTREAARQAVEKQERERAELARQQQLQREREEIARQQQLQREAVDRVAGRVRRDREAAARGERPAMTGHEAADILRINRPPPGVASPFREPPQPTRGGRGAPGRERPLERDR